MTKHYHSAMIGTGQATPMLAVALAGRGEQVAVIEGHLVGGSCVNAGCTPTKTLRKSARVAHMARRAGDFGVSTGDVTVDFAAAMTRMRNLVDKARIGLTGWLKNTDGIEIIRGWGAFQGRDSDRFVLSAGKATLTADKVYLNTGTRAFVPPIPGIADVPHLDNVSLLALTELPRHLIVVGGSYIGLAMGQIFRRLGSEVTVINNASRLADREDADVSAIIQGFFEEEGVRVINDATIERAEKTADGVALHLADGERIQGSHVLFATGRTANCDRLNLGSVGVKTDARGFIPTGADLATNTNGPRFDSRGFPRAACIQGILRITRKDKSAGELRQERDGCADALAIAHDRKTAATHDHDCCGGRVGPVQPSPAGSTLSAERGTEGGVGGNGSGGSRPRNRWGCALAAH